MSGWKIRVQRLHSLGGGPLPRSAFDPRDTTLGMKDKDVMSPAVKHGLVKPTRHKFTWTWELTEKGRDWCEGRLKIVETHRKGSGRGRRAFVATWLKALPSDVKIGAS